MINILKDVLKGAVIGIANIIPGVSGGTMMVAMGIYDKLIHCITHLFKEFKKNVIFLLPIAIGMGVALVASSFGLEYLFENYPLATNLTFIGLILGGMPAIMKKIMSGGKEKGDNMKDGHMLVFLIFFALVVGMGIVGEREGAAADLSFNLVNVIVLFLVGVIAAATMVIPGVSGSMVLLLLGYYEPILESINDFFRALFALDWDGIWSGVGILAPFGVGVLVGIFAIAKLIEIVFAKFPLYAYWAILGLVIASPIAIILMNVGVFTTLNIPGLLIGIVGMMAGFFVAVKIGE